jgi:hypothetical protein
MTLRTKCEGCGKPATNVCSGLEVPMLPFCQACARLHQAQCPDIRDGRAQMTRTKRAADGPKEQP